MIDIMATVREAVLGTGDAFAGVRALVARRGITVDALPCDDRPAAYFVSRGSLTPELDDELEMALTFWLGEFASGVLDVEIALH